MIKTPSNDIEMKLGAEYVNLKTLWKANSRCMVRDHYFFYNKNLLSQKAKTELKNNCSEKGTIFPKKDYIFALFLLFFLHCKAICACNYAPNFRFLA